MKKIININLAGRVIPIEDSAYESLKKYIESLRRYFAHEEGREEIISDIENRIAELMNDKVKKGIPAISDIDMEDIFDVMGRVEDFEEEEVFENTNAGAAGPETTATEASAGKRRFNGRLYRDSSDKIVGGVCSGIAYYVDVDPAIIRVLYAILVFGSAGTGLLLYALLWIILPSRDLEPYIGKRLFRNPDDRIIGGVAGGLGAYFHQKPWHIRLVLIAPFILHMLFNIIDAQPLQAAFGFLEGTFVVAYIVLWIILPLARTTYEKMEMRGETVDVNRIRQNVKEEMEQFKTKAQEWGKEVKSTAHQYGTQAKEFAATRGSAFASEAGQAFRPAAHRVGHFIGTLFKIFFLLVVGFIAFALFTALGFFTLSGVIQPFNDFLLRGFWQNVSLWGTFLLFLGVPLIAFVTWIIRRLMKIRSQHHYIGWVFGGLWLLGFICLGIFVSSMLQDFRSNSTVEQKVHLYNAAIDKLTVRVNEQTVRYNGMYNWIDGGKGFDMTDDSLRTSNVKLLIEKSTDSLYYVTIIKHSAGKNGKDARQRAEKVSYSAFSLDSILVLGSGLGIGKEQKYRGQRVDVEIKVPEGKKIRFDESVAEKFHPVNIRITRQHGWNREGREEDWRYNNNFDWQVNTDYLMTAEGKLEEAEKFKSDSGDVYEYRKDSADSLRRQIKEKQKQIEKDQEQLRKMDKSTFKPEKENTNSVTQHQMPVFSLIIWNLFFSRELSVPSL